MMTAARFCKNCGHAIQRDSQFCEGCGKAVGTGGLTNFTRVRDLFDQAIAIAPERREPWLQEHCNGDPALLAELRGMLTREQDSFLASPAAIPASLLPPTQPLSPPGAVKTIGPYRVMRELGRGGMGVVFLAVRDDGIFRKNVALKLLLGEQVSPEFLQRFKQERQVLAAMDHPNVARILDGGDAPGGMPYYVMEYVEGLPIDRYCDEQRLGLSGRIGIFQQVCQAVHYLHQNSIIHRDLKPANILVSSDGVVKLLDFGIAKVVGAGAYSNPDVTNVQGHPMTPTYASPEQIQGVTLQKTSDIYSLGVLLYLLLTGHPPYQGWDDKKAKLASRAEPPPPSSSIREDLRASPESTARLRKAMLGELDSIVLMALRYDPRDRYQSALDFSNDLQRFLAGNAVTAHHDTMAARSVRLIRRKRAAIAVLAGFLLLGGFGAWQWRRVELQKAEVAAREAQLRSLMDNLETSIELGKPDSEKINDLRKLRKAFAAEFPKVAAARPGQSAQQQGLLERGIRYLDRVAAFVRPPPTRASASISKTDLALELADAYQQLAVLQASVNASTPAARAPAVRTYQKAADVLSSWMVVPGDTRVGDRLVLVRERIVSLGGTVPPAVIETPVEPKDAETKAESRKVVGRERPPSEDPAPAPVVVEAPKPPAFSPAVLSELQDRLANVEARIAIAEQTIAPLRKTLEAQGQNLNANTLSDLSGMRLRLSQAKRYIAAGNEAGARESLTVAQALADRVLKTVGR